MVTKIPDLGNRANGKDRTYRSDYSLLKLKLLVLIIFQH